MTTFNELFLGRIASTYTQMTVIENTSMSFEMADIDAPLVIELVGGGGGGGGLMSRTNTVAGGGGAVGEYIKEYLPSLRLFTTSEATLSDAYAYARYVETAYSIPIVDYRITSRFRLSISIGSGGTAGTTSASAPTPGGTGGFTQVSLLLAVEYVNRATGLVVTTDNLIPWYARARGGQGGRCALAAQNALSAYQTGHHQGGLAQPSTTTTGAVGGSGATNTSMGASARLTTTAATYTYGSIPTIPVGAGVNVGGSFVSAPSNANAGYATAEFCGASGARAGRGGSYRDAAQLNTHKTPGSGGNGGGSSLVGTAVTNEDATAGRSGRATITYKEA